MIIINSGTASIIDNAVFDIVETTSTFDDTIEVVKIFDDLQP